MSQNRRGNIKIVLFAVCAVIAVIIAGSVLLRSSKEDPMAVANSALTFTVIQEEFVSSVNEVGDIESSKNVEIRCEIKSRGRTGTTILELVPEGSIVKKGDFLCQLDDSLLRDEWTEQKIKVAEDRASVIQAESSLESARFALDEFEQGNYAQQLAELKAAVTVAQENERRASDRRKYSEVLNRKGYLTDTQLEADLFSHKKALVELSLAEDAKRVFEKFTRDRMLAELKADIKKQEADLEASQYTLELSLQRESERAEQVANARITAPEDGTLVYANDSDRRDSSVVIEEGAILRDGQPIFYLPDPRYMQVKAKVNDSKINKVKEDQRVEIRVDTAPDVSIEGIVKRVSPYPNPRRYYQAPIEYDVFVEITEQSPLVRSGLRAKVEIFVEQIPEAVQAPVSSLLQSGEAYFVLVRTESGITPRPVEIGSNNDKFVVIKEGLQAGEKVLVDADNYRDTIKLPSAP